MIRARRTLRRAHSRGRYYRRRLEATGRAVRPLVAGVGLVGAVVAKVTWLLCRVTLRLVTRLLLIALAVILI